VEGEEVDPAGPRWRSDLDLSSDDPSVPGQSPHDVRHAPSVRGIALAWAGDEDRCVDPKNEGGAERLTDRVSVRDREPRHATTLHERHPHLRPSDPRGEPALAQTECDANCLDGGSEALNTVMAHGYVVSRNAYPAVAWGSRLGRGEPAEPQLGGTSREGSVSENEGPAPEQPREPESVPEEPASSPEPPAEPPRAENVEPSPPGEAEPEPVLAPPPAAVEAEPEPVPAPPPAAVAPAATTPAATATAAAAAPQFEPMPLLGGPAYPVDVTFPRDRGQGRLWGIPFVGLIIRSFLVIPQLIVLIVLAFIMWFVLLIIWIPVLVMGRQAGFAYTIVGGYLRLSTRVAGYVLLLTGRYPPFGPGGEHPIDVTFDESDRQNRLWGIPLLGVLIRWILLIPHWIVLALIGIVVAFMILVSWVPVLINGRQAAVIIQWIGGFYRWTVRVSAYAFLLTGRYPPFRLED
jgi:hypothetical protein